ncbi:MAG: hypothetical protein WCC48_00485 [Anaeromyxobacteraceae bacterium]
MPEHAVIVHFRYGQPGLEPLRAVESRLEAALAKAGVGEFDGDEIAVNLADGSLYMYGPDADRLFAAIRPVLDATSFMCGAMVRLRYGPPADGTRETVLIITC